MDELELAFDVLMDAIHAPTSDEMIEMLEHDRNCSCPHCDYNPDYDAEVDARIAQEIHADEVENFKNMMVARERCPDCGAMGCAGECLVV